MSTRLSGQFLTVSVPYELGLKEGPEGELLRVVDFDPVRKSWYATVDLDEPYVLAQDGLQPAEGDRAHINRSSTRSRRASSSGSSDTSAGDSAGVAMRS